MSKRVILNSADEAAAALKTRLENLVAKIRATAPPWAGKPPWQIERLLESGARHRQAELFGGEQ